MPRSAVLWLLQDLPIHDSFVPRWLSTVQMYVRFRRRHLHDRQDILEALPLLLHVGTDLLHGEDKAARGSRVRPQLDGPRKLRPDGARVPVGRAAGRDVELAAAGAVHVPGPVDLEDAVGVAPRDRDLAVEVLGHALVAVAVRLERVLAVAVEVDEVLDAVGLLDLLSPLDEGGDLGRVARREAAIRLSARVVGGAARVLPVVRPVAVAVGSNAGRVGTGLAVLSPEAVVGLGVDEAWDGTIRDGFSRKRLMR